MGEGNCTAGKSRLGYIYTHLKLIAKYNMLKLNIGLKSSS